MTLYKYKHYTLDIDYDRDKLLPSFSQSTLRDRYLLAEETSPQEAFARAAEAFADDQQHAQRIYDYASQLWFMFSSPILSNAGTKRGLPISCFLQNIPDSIGGLVENIGESIRLTVSGGGLGAYWGNIRSDGEPTTGGSQTSGSIPFMKVIDSCMQGYHQGTTRRGSAALYQDISHPEIEEFVNMRTPSGGDVNRKCLNLHHAVNITDSFMLAVENDREWDLIDPNSSRITKTIRARALWQKILETRVQTGEPYLHFVDTTNRLAPKMYIDKDWKVTQSNLCSEITLYTDEERTAVCCLSSVNLEKWDYWQASTMVKDLIRYLDNVLSAFVLRGGEKEGFEKAVYSASQERSLGLGAMGFHSLLQSRNIPFESALAKSLNMEIFSNIRADANEATRALAEERGEAPDAEGYGVRNCHLMAVAPNASSSIICGVTSPSVEPWSGNAYTQKTQSGNFLIKNKYLDEIIKDKYEAEYDDVWSSIISRSGSAQHLDRLTDWEKDVFKTAYELDQHWVVSHAADRQLYIDQAQSINVFFEPDANVAYLHSVHWDAWDKGLKTMYYLRSDTIRQAETIGKTFTLDDKTECLACEG